VDTIETLMEKMATSGSAEPLWKVPRNPSTVAKFCPPLEVEKITSFQLQRAKSFAPDSMNRNFVPEPCLGLCLSHPGYRLVLHAWHPTPMAKFLNLLLLSVCNLLPVASSWDYIDTLCDPWLWQTNKQNLPYFIVGNLATLAVKNYNKMYSS